MRFLTSLSLLIILFTLNIYAKDISLSKENNRFAVTEKSENSFKIINQLNLINTNKIKTENGEFVKLTVPYYSSNSEIGSPELPSLKKLISVPNDAEINIEIIHKESKKVKLSEFGINQYILPRQPSISKGSTADEIVFHINNKIYKEDRFFQDNIVSTELLGKMREVQLARIIISPFSYNPLKQELEIITSLEIKVSFTNASEENNQMFYSAEFEHLYKKCINYLPPSPEDIITTYPVKYVIISDPLFQTPLQPLIEWKTKKGFHVVESYTNDPNVGTTTASIKSYVQGLYDNATVNDPAPTYLLLVGDVSQIPSFSGNSGSHISDLYYCEFDGGGDFYPEMYYGRFSANTVDEVEHQVEKTLTHEKYLFSDPNFLDDIVLVAGVDANYAPTYGNGQINYATDNYFNIAHNLTIHNYLYGSGTPITSDMAQASASIISNVSEGTGLANYTAHCGSNGWGDPSFNTGDVASLQNYDEYGLVISNCCLPNKFDEPVCFGEALLRADNKGALGHIGASNNTYWDEDYWWSVGNTSNISANPTYSGTGLGAYDCWMHENGEHQNDWFITQAQILHAGNLAVTEAGGAEQYYWEIYHLMGDPSLMPYVGIPTSLNVSHNAILPTGASSFVVNSEENSYVALSMNGILLDAQLCDASGVVNLNFSPISNVGNIDIVVTKQFKQPYISTIQATSPNGPYVNVTNNFITDINGNNNSLADYSETVNLDVDLFNLGGGSSQNLNLVLSSTDQYITIIDSLESVSSINSNQTITTTNAFIFQIADLVPDQHVAIFQLNISDNQGNIWNSNINVTLNSPILNHISFTVNDLILGNGNGKLDAGENLELIVEVNNTGHADAYNLTANLSSLSSYITLNSSSASLPHLNTTQSQIVSFNITVDNNTPVGTNIIFPFNINDQIYSYQTDFSEFAGEINEDYESGDFSNYSWLQGTFPWVVDANQIYEGSYSSRSAFNLPDGEESELSIYVNVLSPGDISFYKFVSSEFNFDFLKFKINGTKVGEWSGEDSVWSFVSFPVNNTGTHTFKWEYDKDGSWSDGDDCAWIDYIVFPPIYVNQTIINDNDFRMNIYPNPSLGIFNLSFNDNKKHNIEITNLSGKQFLYVEDIISDYKFDFSKLPAGSYFINVLPENIKYQIIKQ
tara:strand:- start:2688 stop:6125 length:3438 start_codon:yes stop_codon:yes gene_type:complete